MRLDGTDYFTVEEPGIAANPYLTHRSGQLGETCPKQPDGAAGGVHVPRSEVAVPEISGLALEAEQGVIRWPAPFGGCSLATLSRDAHRGSAPVTVVARRIDYYDLFWWRSRPFHTSRAGHFTRDARDLARWNEIVCGAAIHRRAAGRCCFHSDRPQPPDWLSSSRTSTRLLRLRPRPPRLWPVLCRTVLFHGAQPPG